MDTRGHLYGHQNRAKFSTQMQAHPIKINELGKGLLQTSLVLSPHNLHVQSQCPFQGIRVSMSFALKLSAIKLWASLREAAN